MVGQKVIKRLMVGLVVSCVQLPAYAEERAIEEVVVTATKRETTVMDVPASLTAFSEDEIDLTEITNNRDLQFTVPGLVAGYFNGSSLLAIRGIGANSTNAGGDPAVAQHIDGVYQTRIRTVALAVSDLQRVEVLKGPQGTLYGRNSTGGAINYITNKPTEEFEGSVSVTAGNFGRVGTNVMLSGPLSDTVSMRGNFYYNDQDGYLKVVGGGGSPDGFANETIGGRLALRFTPSDDLTIDVNVTTVENETISPAQILGIVNPAAAFYLFPGNHTTNVNEVVSDTDASGEISQDSVTATLDWAINDQWSLKSITGFLDNSYHQLNYDVDYSSAAFFPATGGIESESDSLSQEFNLNYSGERINLVSGLFYLKDDFLQASAFPIFGVVLSFDQQSEAWAAFADVTVDVTEQFRVIAGIRYNSEDREITQLSSLACPVPVSGGESWSDTNPKVGFQYDFGENAVVYGTWQEGFKSGGYDPSNCLDSFNPESIEAIEIGLKTTLFDGAGLLTVAIYDYDYTDLQVTQLVGLATVVENASEADVQGIDIEFQYALSDSFTMELSGSFLDTEQNDLFLADPHGAPGAPTVNVGGKTLLRAPDFSGTFALSYGADFNNGNALLLRGEYYYSDDVRYSFFDAEPGAFQDSYTIGNLYADFALGAVEGLSFQAFVKNVSDEETIQGILPFGAVGLQLGNYNRGRTYGLEVQYDF